MGGDYPINAYDYTSATESHKRALKIRQTVLGENHENTTKSYHWLGITQYMLCDYTSATESHKQALKIRQTVLGKNHEKTAESHYYLGITQYKLSDHTSATESLKRAINIKKRCWVMTKKSSLRVTVSRGLQNISSEVIPPSLS